MSNLELQEPVSAAAPGRTQHFRGYYGCDNQGIVASLFGCPGPLHELEVSVLNVKSCILVTDHECILYSRTFSTCFPRRLVCVVGHHELEDRLVYILERGDRDEQGHLPDFIDKWHNPP